VSITAFYSGSFDPPTNGHVDVIKRACSFAGRLVIGVGVHHEKRGFLSDDERVRLLRELCADEAASSSTQIDVVTFDNLAVDAARDNGASVIVRGLRNATDFDYEQQMAGMNQTMAPDLEQVFLLASPDVAFVSSSLVRQIASMGGDISPFVPDMVSHAVKTALAG